MLFTMWLGSYGFPNEIKPHDDHTVVDLYQVVNPCSAKCWDSEVALLTSQEGDRRASRC